MCMSCIFAALGTEAFNLLFVWQSRARLAAPFFASCFIKRQKHLLPLAPAAAPCTACSAALRVRTPASFTPPARV